MTFDCKKCLTSYKRIDSLKKHLEKPCVPKIGNNTIVSVTNISDWLSTYTIPKKLDEAETTLPQMNTSRIYNEQLTNKASTSCALTDLEETKSRSLETPNSLQISDQNIKAPKTSQRLKSLYISRRRKKHTIAPYILNYTANNENILQKNEAKHTHIKTLELSEPISNDEGVTISIDDQTNGHVSSVSLGDLLDQLETETNSQVSHNDFCNLYDDLHLTPSPPRRESSNSVNIESIIMSDNHTLPSHMDNRTHDKNVENIISLSEDSNNSLKTADIDWDLFKKLAQAGRKTTSELNTVSPEITEVLTFQENHLVTLQPTTQVVKAPTNLIPTLAQCIQDIKFVRSHINMLDSTKIKESIDNLHLDLKNTCKQADILLPDTLLDVNDILFM